MEYVAHDIVRVWEALDGGSSYTELIAVLYFGDGLEVLERRTTGTQVRLGPGRDGWVIARNELFDHYKRASRERGTFDPSVSALTDLAPTPSAAVAANDERAAMTLALREIPLELQVAVELHYWEELTTAELADALGVPQGTAKSRLRRAKSLLRDRLGPGAGFSSDGDEPDD